MALYQNSILRKYANQLQETDIENAWQQFHAHFHNPTIQQNIKESKEEQYQEGFINDLFVKVLGYIKNPQPDFNITTEYKNEKDAKKADGAIIIDDKVLAVIELKGTETTDFSKIETQAFGYKNNQSQCIYVITSNFEKLRFYIDNAIDYLEFNLFQLTKKEFELLYLSLHYQQIKNGIPKKMKDESIVQEADITKKLYKDYSEFKRVLFTNLCERNPEHDQLDIFKKTQKLLDRFLFVFFAEDRGLIPPYSVRKIISDWDTLKELDVQIPLLDRFRQFFNYFNTGYKGKDFEIYAYNGGLFAPDEFIDSISIDDELLYKYTVLLADYNFESDVDVNILGHIFENSLNEIDEIKAHIAGEEIDKGKTKRKKDGVFYTPKYITKYIVENTVGKLCEEKKQELQLKEEEYITDKKRNKATVKKLQETLQKYRNWLLEITICDPACGSGAFLNQALEFLIKEHRYIDELQAKLFGDAFILTDIEGSILENNLYGVDLNEESVEIAKLSLWLRTAQPNRKLNNLNNNLKCGNSLIDDPEIAGDKAFNWKKEFPKVFAKGGFDVVVGNPPYVLMQPSNTPEKLLNYFKDFEVSSYKIDLFHLFFEKSILLLKNNGSLGFITPNTYLTNKYIQKLRKFILDNTTINTIVNYEDSVFVDAGVDVATIVLEKIKQSNTKTNIYTSNKGNLIFVKSLFQDEWLNDKENIFNLNKELSISFDNYTNLEDICQVTFGLQTKDKSTYVSDFKISDEWENCYTGSDISRYFLKESSLYFKNNPEEVKAGGSWNMDIHHSKKIVVRQVGNPEPIFAFDNYAYATLNTMYSIVLKSEDFNYFYLLSILNSSLMKYYFLSKYSDGKQLFPKVKGFQLKQLPIKKITLSDQQPFIAKADQMLSLNSELQSLVSKFLSLLQSEFGLEKFSKKLETWYELSFGDFTKELKKQKVELSLSQKSEWMDFFAKEQEKALAIRQEIEKTDKEIDRMVYELYGLTEEEVGIVEG